MKAISVFFLTVALFSMHAQAADWGGLWDKTKEVASDSYDSAKDYSKEKWEDLKAAKKRRDDWVDTCAKGGMSRSDCEDKFDAKHQ
jgi:hypothetical protein